MNTSSPKIFVLELGILLSLYVTISFLITLLFGVINIYFPDALQYGHEYDSAVSSVRVGIASVIVFFPVFIILNSLVTKSNSQSEYKYAGLIRWFMYLSLLLAGAVLLGDLVVLILSFLEGELTVRFLLKVLTVLVVVGSAFSFYLLDISEFWQKNKGLLKIVSIASVGLVSVIIAVGFYSIVGPSEAREMGLDAKQVSDLREISYQIDNYVSKEKALPDSLEDIYVRAVDKPTAPEDRPAYAYKKGEGLTYELCAEFAYSSDGGNVSRISYEPTYKDVNWTHDAGWWCYSVTATEPKLLD